MELYFIDPATGEEVFTLAQVAEAKLIGHYGYMQAGVWTYPIAGGEGDTDYERTTYQWSQVVPILQKWAEEMHIRVDNKAGFVIELNGNQFLLFYKDCHVYLGPLSEAKSEYHHPLNPEQMVPYAPDTSALQVLHDYMEIPEVKEIFQMWRDLVLKIHSPHLVQCDECKGFIPERGCLSHSDGVDDWYQCYQCLDTSAQAPRDAWKKQLIIPEWKQQLGRDVCREWKTNPLLRRMISRLDSMKAVIPNLYGE